MKRASYREAVHIIAHNDEPTGLDVVEIQSYTTTLLIAWIFAVEPAKVARDILRERERRDAEESETA